MSITLNIDESVFNNKKKNLLIETKGKTTGENLNYSFKQNPVLKNLLFNEDGNLSSGIIIKINGKFVTANELMAPVKDGDTIEVLKYDG
jgi:hypothetical protein